MAKADFFIDAIPLVETRPSGVSHALAGLTEALLNHSGFNKDFQAILIIPKGKADELKQWNFRDGYLIKELALKRRAINGLIKYGLLPKMDRVIGAGIYLFGNYRNWPLSKRSYSYTYIHDIIFALQPEFVAPKNQKMLIKNVPRFIKQADTVITVSDSSRQEIIDFYKLSYDKIITLHNGYDQKIFHGYPPADIAKVKRKYSIESEYIIFDGNIEPRKNLERLIEAYSLLSEDLQAKYALVLVGADGWLNEPIYKALEAARREGKNIVHPKTFVPDEDLAVLMCGAQLLVHPALYEGFGMPPLEAMASGTPVVASNIKVLKEILGTAAVFFNATDAKDISQKLALVLNDSKLREQLRKEGLARAAKFTWAKSADLLSQHLTQVKIRKL